MDIGAVIIQLKPNTIKNVESWKNEINRRKIEALETLVAEDVHIESWFCFELNNQYYLMAYMRATDIAKAQAIGRQSIFSIDVVHKAFKQNWEKVIPMQLLLDLENEDYIDKKKPKY